MANKTSVASPSDWMKTALPVDIKERCELLWTTENPFYDTVIKVQDHKDDPGKEFRVHKLILAMGSGKFASQLYDKFGQDPSIAVDIPLIIEMHDLTANIMKLVLEFLYTDFICRRLEWPEVGGLVHAAKQLDIPRLSEFCTDLFESQLSCEHVLEILKRVTTLRHEDVKWPKNHYKELLTMSYSYILRNGEVILRAKQFLELSFQNIDSFISSDFLICAEITLYKNLKRWAKHQCKKLRMDANQIQNRRNVLKGCSEDNLGLLGHVRFPLMDDDTFDSIHKNSSSLLANEFAEKVYEYYTISEPTGIFSEKERHTQINNENSAAFDNHINQLSTLSLPPIFCSNESVGSTRKSFSQATVSNPDSGTPHTRQATVSNPDSGTPHTRQATVSNPDSGTSRISQATVSNPDLVSTHFSQKVSLKTDVILDAAADNTSGENRDNHELARIIKIERNADEENSSFPALQYPEPMLQVRIPLSNNNQDHIVPIDEKKAEFHTPVKRKIIKKIAEDEGVSVSKIQKVMKNRGNTLTPTQNGAKKLTWSQIVRNNTGIVSSEKGLIYSKKRQKIKYLDVINECSKNPRVSKIILEDIEIDDATKLKHVPSTCLSGITDFLVSASVGKIKQGSLIQNLASINLDQYVFFYRGYDNPQIRLSDLWASNINARLTFNGITVLEVRSQNLTLNYTQNSSFFGLNAQTLPNIKSLNLGNCIIPKDNWLKRIYAEQLVELRLLCVSGLKCSHILEQCQTLKSFCVWPVDKQITRPTLCLDDIKSKKLQHLSIHDHLVKFNPNSNCEFSTVEEICLSDCSLDPSFIYEIPKLFPNLRKMFIGVRSYGADLLKTLVSMNSLEEIGMWNLDVKSLNEVKHFKMKQFLKGMNITSGSGELNLNIKRSDGEWRGSMATNKELRKRIYESFGFEQFYTFDSWVNYFYAQYDDF